MWCHWYQQCCHVMLPASSVAPFWSLDDENWNKVSHDTGDLSNGTILFIRSRWLKQNATWLLCYRFMCYSITWHWWHHQYHHWFVSSIWLKLYECMMIEMECNMTFSVLWHCWHWHQHHVIMQHDFFRSSDTVGTDINIMWFPWQC